MSCFFYFPKRVLIVLLAVLSISACTSQPKTQSSVFQAKSADLLDSTLQSYIDSGQVAGISALVFEKDKEVYFKALGYADRDAGTPMARDTIVRIYSMTKPVTGVALMQMHERGAFKLDDPLSWYLPKFGSKKVCVGRNDDGSMILEPAKREISVRDITRHTAGFALRNDECLGELVSNSSAFSFDNTLAQAVDALADMPLGFHPGEEWAYGPSVDVQARLVEVLSEAAFADYIQSKILDPLQMNTTAYQVASENRSRFSALYDLGDDGQLSQRTEREGDINTSAVKLTPGGWGLTSTIDDYARFARMLANEGELDGVRILQPETVRMMASNHLEESVTERMWLPSKGEVGFGIDFAVRVREAKKPEDKYGEIGEFFWDGAASTMFWVDPKNDLVAVLFVQLFPFDNINLHKRFKDAVYGIEHSE